MSDSTIASKIQQPNPDKLEVANGGTLVVGSVTIHTDASNHLIFTSLPTADPHVVGALWANAGVVTVSAG